MNDEQDSILFYLSSNTVQSAKSSVNNTNHIKMVMYAYYRDEELLEAVLAQVNPLRLYRRKDFAAELVENYKKENEKAQALLRKEIEKKDETIARLEQQLSFLRAGKCASGQLISISGATVID